MSNTDTQTLGFQTEIRQLLDLMVHSLYSNKEIFLRELISNAADAADKLRFEALAKPDLYEEDADLRIEIEFDRKKWILTVRDNGIGMSRQEVIDNIGTIARSGTAEFFKSLSGDKQKDAQLIGQFGVGFYSAFIVAEKVELLSRRAGAKPEEGVRWASDGQGEYTIETITRERRGTEVILHLRKEEKEFLDGARLRRIVHKYSDHINLPIYMPKEDGKGMEVVNDAKALWTLDRKQISDEEYKSFYQHLSHDIEPPLAWVHSRVEGKLQYTLLLYIPARAPFDLWDRERRHGIKLYVKRVFIMDDAEELMPPWLRFVRGLVDSDDLPLNVSREILQRNRTIDAIRKAAVKKVLGMLEKLGRDEEKYATFWDNFGRVLKEGIIDDADNRDRIAKLLRFSSTHLEGPEQRVSLADYASRMKEGQKAIYYHIADSWQASKASPHLEVFRDKGYEVLLLSDPIDEWLVGHLTEFEGHPLKSVAKGELDLEDEEDRKKLEQAVKEHGALMERIRQALSDRVKLVRASTRLTDSPACLVADEHDMGRHMERLLRAAGQVPPPSRPIMEINVEHPLIQRMEKEEGETRFREWANVLFETALLAEGNLPPEPGDFVRRLNNMMLELAGEKRRIWTPED